MAYKKIKIVLLLLVVALCAQAVPPGDTIIRGTWITNVASDALLSKKNVRKTVKQCKAAGLNHIFVVVWNGGVTMYPSKLVQRHIGIRQSLVYKGFDPIRTIIREAHKAGLKVHAWFEFGFSYAYKDSNSIWLQRHPDWAGRDKDGKLLQKNGFYWWNALHPEVQFFMDQLVSEVVRKYNFDGVQGDDRLPAMPAEGGYDDFTRQLYAHEHNGAALPADPREPAFLQWKANKLSRYGKRLYETVKKIKPNCMISWAPSIYPWSKEQYLQDWPQWLSGGYADLVIPQLYRYNISAYEKILKELAAQVPDSLRHKVVPGILTSLGDGYQSSPELTQQMMALNRQYGFGGEVFFYFETLNRLKQKLYPDR
jgi:uncharacterized lipoprotein YddW (UPF0748 family)